MAASPSSWKIPPHRLTSLAELKANVDLEASLHLPDLVYDITKDDKRIKFDVLALSEMLAEYESDVIGARITIGNEEKLYTFSKWSRSQLLTLLGAREKWFSRVPLSRQADELNARLHVMNSYNFRTMRALDEDFPLRFVRGLVSAEYADIPNTEIMDAIIAKAPADAMVLRGPSGISDRAFYAYVVVPSPITIPNTTFFAYPAAVVKNSEVGYTSLYVIPGILMLKWAGRLNDVIPVVLESKAVLKKIHRGKIDLAARFEQAFTECASMWSGMSSKIPTLATKAYPTDDATISAMRNLLLSSHAQKDFVEKCVKLYKSAQRTQTALDIVNVIAEVCAEINDRDEQYIVGAIAGAVLYKLMF